MEETKPAERHITIGLILGWGFGVLFIMAGAAQLVSEPIAAVLLVLAGAILIPPTNAFVRKQFNFNLSGGVKFILALVLAVVAGSMAGKEAIDKAADATNNQQPAAEQAENNAAPVAARTYQQVFTFSGNGAKQSEPFTITGDRFKVKYDCQGDFCSAFLHEVGSDLHKGLIMNTTDAVSDETIFYDAGEYYINANTMGTYTFTVEDYK